MTITDGLVAWYEYPTPVVDLPVPPTEIPVIPEGFCQCGCGQRTKIARYSRANRGWVKGQPLKWIAQHTNLSPVECLLDPSTGCWIWQRGKSTRGYGVKPTQDGKEYAHRHYYELAYGPIPEGLDVCHTCDNPSCVNPAHMFLGTAKDNALDMVAKGRARNEPHRGEDNGNSRFTEEDIREMRRMYADGVSQTKIAHQFHTSQGSVGDIVRRETWKHIE